MSGLASPMTYIEQGDDVLTSVPTLTNIENNQLRLQYDQALAQGLPIATGVIEGAC